MEDIAKRHAIRNARLVRHTTRMQVLTDILKATSDSLKDLVESATADEGIDAVVRAITTPPGTAERRLGSQADPTVGDPSSDTSREQHPLSRRTVTRGTLLGILDRLDDALERDDEVAAVGASRELRNLVDDLPL